MVLGEAEANEERDTQRVGTHFSPKVADKPHITIPIRAIQKFGAKATSMSPADTERPWEMMVRPW